MESLKYGAYSRKSTEDDARQVLSIEAQKDQIKKVSTGLNVKMEFSESKSAYKDRQRTEFGRMLEALDKGEINAVIAWHPDRLSRNETDAAEITRRIRTGIIKDLKFASGVGFDNTPESMMMLQMTQAQSQYYSSKLSKDVKRGNEKKRQLGGLTGRAPEGYLNMNTEVLIDPERFPLIRQAFDLFLTGEYSVPVIHKIMDKEWGYKTLKHRKSGGKMLAIGSLYNIFRNVRYAGLVPDPYSDDLYPASYQTMITKDEYDRVQELLGKHGMPRLTPKNKDFPLRGFIKCGVCGCMITAETTKKELRDGTTNYHNYYHCTGRRGGCVQRKQFTKEQDLSDQLTSLLDKYELAPKMYEWAMTAFRELAESETERRDVIQHSQTNAIKSTQEQLDRLLDMATRGLIDEGEYKDKSISLKQTLEQLHKEQNDTSERVKNWYEVATKTFETLTNANEKFSTGDVNVKKEILLAIGQNPVLIDRKLSITPNAWLLPVANVASEMRAELNKVRTDAQQIEKDPEEALISTWQGHVESNHDLRFWRPLY